MNMKVLLLNPFFRERLVDSRLDDSQYLETPLGILYISAYLKKHLPGCRVEVLDAHLLMETHPEESMDQLYGMVRATVQDFAPDVIGLSALYYASAYIVHKIARLIKEVDASIRVVIGGSYATHLCERAMEDTNIDFAVLSEGEEVFRLLIDAMSKGDSVAQIPGVAWRNEDSGGKVIVNRNSRTFIKDLDTIPFPDREAVPMDRYFRGGRNVLYRFFSEDQIRIGSLVSSRGCPNQCTFCGSKGFWGRKIRFRNPSRVVDEMVEMHQRYEVDTFVLNDDNYCASPSRFRELMNLIQLRLPGARWCSGGGTSIRSIDDEDMIKRMYDAGVVYFNLAFESGSDETLRRIKKPLTTAEGRRVVELIRKHGDAYITGFFIIGFPFETRAEVLGTIEFARDLDLDWTCLYNFQPFPGSELYDYCMQHGMIDQFDTNYGELFRPSNIRYQDFTAEELSKLNYDMNIEINFVHNRNLHRNPRQALRDFDYVLTLAKDHLLASFMQGKVLERLKRREEAIQSFAHVRAALQEPSLFSEYFERYGLKPELEIVS